MKDSGNIQYLLTGQSGNLSLRTDYHRGMSKSFTYDPVLKSRLESWSINNVLQAQVHYDNNGNIVNKSDVNLPGGSYLYNSGNKPHAVHSV
ncbi:MAG: hypothetical protein U1C46_07510, partial [Bacteroidales bacterium]|nr:hypothetical protein [Bacteroidales bacterium]